MKKENVKSFILWFTGLSGSGKSTLAREVDARVRAMNIRAYVLDGDSLRSGLNKDLGFSDEDRMENIRRAGEVAKLLADAGFVVLAAFISPFQSSRDMVRRMVERDKFIEVYVKCPMDVCEKRDTKGLYQKAKSGQMKNFTGIDSPYEEPLNSEIVIETQKLSVGESVNVIMEYLINKNFISK